MGTHEDLLSATRLSAELRNLTVARTVAVASCETICCLAVAGAWRGWRYATHGARRHSVALTDVRGNVAHVRVVNFIVYSVQPVAAMLFCTQPSVGR